MILKIDSEIELRQLESGDSKEIFHAIDSQRKYLGRWLPFVEFTRDLSDSEKFVESMVNAPEDRFEYVFTIRKRNEFAGMIGFKGTEQSYRKTEIGYWLSKKFQKQGIMTRAVEKMCNFAFHDLGLNRVQIKCAVENEASINIPRRLGFKFEGIERDGELLTGNIFTDLVVYSKLKSY